MVYLLDFFPSGNHFYVLLSPYLCFISFLYLDFYDLGGNSWIIYGVFHANQTTMCIDPHLN